MPNLSRIEGPNLVLRLVEPVDAEYVYGLRMNPAYNQHLSAVQGSADDQRAWIEAYKIREADGQELYYVIERRGGVRCGLVRLYDIIEGQFTWGSWILDENKTQKAALEAALLSFGAGFSISGMQVANVDVRRSNIHALKFYQRFGMTETHANELDIFFTYCREKFLQDRDMHLDVLTGSSPDVRTT